MLRKRTIIGVGILLAGCGGNAIMPPSTAGSPSATLTHDETVTALDFSPDGQVLASGGLGKKSKEPFPELEVEIALWDVATRTRIHTIRNDDLFFLIIKSLSFSPDGKTLASCSMGVTFELWDVATGELKYSFEEDSAVNCVAFSPDGKTIASGCGDGTVNLWDAASGKRITALTGHEVEVSSMAYSPDGRALASGGPLIQFVSDDGLDAEVIVWDLSTGQPQTKMKMGSYTIDALEFSPDGHILASVGGPLLEHGELVLRYAATGKPKATLRYENARIASCLAFSPDGTTLVSGTADGIIMVWDAATGELSSNIQGHNRDVRCVAFSPDGKTLASGSVDGTVKLWDAAAFRDPQAR